MSDLEKIYAGLAALLVGVVGWFLRETYKNMQQKAERDEAALQEIRQAQQLINHAILGIDGKDGLLYNVRSIRRNTHWQNTLMQHFMARFTQHESVLNELSRRASIPFFPMEWPVRSDKDES